MKKTAPCEYGKSWLIPQVIECQVCKEKKATLTRPTSDCVYFCQECQAWTFGDPEKKRVFSNTFGDVFEDKVKMSWKLILKKQSFK